MDSKSSSLPKLPRLPKDEKNEKSKKKKFWNKKDKERSTSRSKKTKSFVASLPKLATVSSKTLYLDIFSEYNITEPTVEERANLSNLYVSCLNSSHDIHDEFCDEGIIDWPLVDLMFSTLPSLSKDIQDAAQAAVNNTCQSICRGDAVIQMDEERLSALSVLLLYPGFSLLSSYVTFADVLGKVAGLSKKDAQRILENLNGMSSSQLRTGVKHLNDFINTRLFPLRPQQLPPMCKCTWWIPCAVTAMDLFNLSNERISRIEISDLYNNNLDHWDLKNDYEQWKKDTKTFSFCKYSFILSLNAKRTLLETHAETQMMTTARDSIIRNLVSNSTPDPDELYLNITVRRDHILQDSLIQLSKAKNNIRKKLRIHFAGEPGLDMGGLTKEWFQLVVCKLFDPDYGMFTTGESSECYWFMPWGAEKSISKLQDKEVLNNYHLIGVLMGVALYNSVILDVKLPPCCYKKLLYPPTLSVDSAEKNKRMIGMYPNFTLLDLQQIMPETAKSLQELLDYEGDVENDMLLSFEVVYTHLGRSNVVPLKPNGSNILVDNKNRKDYVNLYIDFFLNVAVDRQFKAFYYGFHMVCSSALLTLIKPAEIELLVCGNPKFDIKLLRDVVKYDNYAPQDKTIKYLWEVLFSLEQSDHRRFLRFVTGTDRIPAGGSPVIKVLKMATTDPDKNLMDMLPISHTCFNQLSLPDYQDKSILRNKLIQAMQMGSNGFYLA